MRAILAKPRTAAWTRTADPRRLAGRGAGGCPPVRWAASAAILAACVLALRGRVAAVDASGGLPGLGAFALAVSANAAANAVLVSAWRGLLAAAGAPLDGRVAARVWSSSQLARYAIGGAQFAGRAVAGRRHGVRASRGTMTALVEVGWSAAVTGAVALATAPWWLPPASSALAWAGALPVAALAVLLVRPDLARLDGLDRGAAARITALYTLNATLRLAAFLALFAAVGGSVTAEGLRAAGALALGQLAGWAAVFAPGGLGPREGATALAVAPAVGGGPALVLVASTRLAELLAEALFAAAARLRRPAT